MKKKILTLILPAVAMITAACGEQKPCDHKDENHDHICDVCNEKISEHKDDNKDHKCDVCEQSMGEHADKDNDHKCDYCGESMSEHKDENKDHKCDICGASMGEHADKDNDHNCDYCSEKISDHKDDNKDHKCDICGQSMGEHADHNNDHNCDYCGEKLSDHADSNHDHKCDVCGASMGEHADNDNDHKCDYCGESMSEHKDENKDHKCDICGASMGEHADKDNDHNCDYCGEKVSEHTEPNEEGKCDICGEQLVPPTPVDRFQTIKDNVNKNHNYTMSIFTHLDNDDSEYDYIDFQKNINDKALFMSGETIALENYGLISLKDQGYVWFGSDETQVYGDTPYSTNYEKGIHEIYDLNLENLLSCNFVQDSQDKTKYSTTDELALSIMYSYSGYSYSWSTDDGVVDLKVDENEDKLTFTYGFSMYYYDEITYQETIQHAVATVVAEDINSTHDAIVESFIENPTAVYPVKTEWSGAEQLMFQQKFNNLVPSFIPGVTWTFDIYSAQEYDGNHIYASDLDSGDQREAYGNLLVQNDGFVKVNNNQYKKVVDDVTAGKQTTWTVNMTYHAPSEAYGDTGKTYGDYYKKGYFEVEYFSKQTNITIDTLDKLNAYMSANGYDEFVPLFPTSTDVTGIKKFNDKTSGVYAFYTGTAPFEVNFTSAAKAKEYLESYIYLLEQQGFTKSGSFMGMVNYCLKDTPNESFVSLTDPESVGATAQITFKLYTEDFAEPELKSIELSGYTTKYSVGDEFSFDGIVKANYTTKPSQVITSGYSVSDPDMSTAGEKTVTVSYTEGDITKTASYKIQVGVGERKLNIGYLENCTIAKINGSYNTDNVVVNAGSKVTVQLSIGSKYQVSEIKVTDSKGNVTVPTLVEGETKIYEFVMPDSDATLSVIAEEVAPAPTFSVNVDSDIENGSIKNILVNGTAGNTAKAGDTVRFTVSANENYSIVADSVKVTDGEGNPVSISLAPMSASSYTFTMPSSNVTITAEFEADIPAPTHAISFEADHTSDVTFYSEGLDPITKFESGDGFMIYMHVEAGYQYASAELEGDSAAQIYNWDDEGYFVLYVIPSKVLDEYNVSAVFEAASPEPTSYGISVDGSITGGSIKNIVVNGSASTEAEAGDTVRFTVSANEDYKIVADSVKVTDGEGNPVSISLAPMSASSYTFTMPSSNVTITAEFEADIPEPTKYAINKDTIEGATIKVAGMISEAEEGEVVKFSVDLEDGYTLNSVSIKDHPEIQIDESVNPFTGATTYMFDMPAFDVTISADVLEPAPAKAWHVEADSSIENGSITFAESYYDTDEKVEFTVTPDSGYEIESVTSNPSVTITDEGDGKYSFNMPSSDVVVSATFKEQAGPGPTPTPSTTQYHIAKKNAGFDLVIDIYLNSDHTGSFVATRSDGYEARFYFIWSTEDNTTYTVVQDASRSSEETMTFTSGNWQLYQNGTDPKSNTFTVDANGVLTIKLYKSGMSTSTTQTLNLVTE